MVFSQNKASKAVADISISDTKLHISYSDGSMKDISVPSDSSRYYNIISYSSDTGGNRDTQYYFVLRGPDGINHGIQLTHSR